MLKKYLLLGSTAVLLLGIPSSAVAAVKKNSLKQRLKSFVENQQFKTDKLSNTETKKSDLSRIKIRLSTERITNLLPSDYRNNNQTSSFITNKAKKILSNVAQLSQSQKEDSKRIKSTSSLESLQQNNAQAADLLGNSPKSINQVTNVSQLDDVQPTDWAYEALRNLVERYGCIAGYPNGTFRGNRAMTRYEFAAGLNACLEQVARLIEQSSAEAVRKQDLETLQRLSADFQAELATLRQRVDTLEERTAILEKQQFSTTTKLNGEVIFALSSAFGGDPPGGCRISPDGGQGIPGEDANTDPDVSCVNRGKPARNTVFSQLVRLGLQTSFTGKDVLRTFLTTGNFSDGGFTNATSLNTYMARLSHQADLDNQVILDLMEYRVPAFGDRVVFSVIPFGFQLSNVLSANSPYFDTGRGSISRFGEASPIYKIGGVLDAGVGFDWLIADPVRLQVAYGTGDSGNPDKGFFGADRSVLGVQLVLKPTEKVITGLTYVNAYSSDGTLGTFTGSVNAETSGLWSDAAIPSTTLGSSANPNPNAPSGFGACCGLPVGDLGAKINAVGGTLQWRLSDKITLGAWGGYIFTNFLDALPNDPVLGNSAGKKPYGNSATYLFSLGISDPFGREGDLFGFLFGMPPKLVDAGPETVGVPVPFFETSRRGEEEVAVTDNNPNILNGRKVVGVEDEATSLHFELFYRFTVSDNLSITPGFFFVTNPGHIANNDTLFVGTVRTTFRF